MLSAVEVLKQAREFDLHLGIERGATLTFQPADRCPREFVDTLRAHKGHLLALLQLSFAMAYSETLQDTIFLCLDEHTKTALVEAGADTFSIYTRDELQVLVAHNRAKPFIPDELLQLHAIKRTFNATINETSN